MSSCLKLLKKNPPKKAQSNKKNPKQTNKHKTQTFYTCYFYWSQASLWFSIPLLKVFGTLMLKSMYHFGKEVHKLVNSLVYTIMKWSRKGARRIIILKDFSFPSTVHFYINCYHQTNKSPKR